MQALIKNHFNNENVVITDEANELYLCTEVLLNLIKSSNKAVTDADSNALRHYDSDSDIDIKNSAIFCLETILWFYDKLPDIRENFEDSLTDALLKTIYSVRLDDISEKCYCMLMRSALNALRCIAFENRDWCKEYIGDVLGACISNILFGLPDIVHRPPQKVQSSQQTVSDKQNVISKKGGKLIKGRRPRQKPTIKHRKSKTNQNNDTNDDGNEINDAHSILFIDSG